MTDRQLIADFRKKPSFDTLKTVVRAYHPLVKTVVEVQTSDPAEVRDIVRIVFRCLAKRMRRLSKNTSLPAWLVRTASFAGHRWSQDRQTEPGQASSQANPAGICLQALNRLPVRDAEVLVANVLHGYQPSKAAARLGTSIQRFEKRLKKGQRKLYKHTRKLGLPQGLQEEPLSLGFLDATSSEVEATDLDDLVTNSLQPSPPSRVETLTLRSWTWLRWKRRFKFLGAAAGVSVMLLVSLGLFIAWAWQTGHLMSWLIPWGAKRSLAEYPELGLPPRHWSEAGLQLADMSERADLFGPTNIWRADFNFTAKQWAGITPSKIQPANLFRQDGTILLRNPNAKRSGLAGVLGIEFNWTQANLQFGGQSFTNIAARYRGNGTYVSSLYGKKQSIKIDLNKSHPGQKIFGIDKLNFNNLVEDATFMHDALGYALFRAAGVAAPRTAYVWMTIQIEGQAKSDPRGFYLMLENIDARFAKDRFGTSKTPVFKPVTPDLFLYLGEDWAPYAPIYDLKTEATERQKQQVIQFAKCLTQDDDETFARRVEDFLDLDQFSRYLASIVLIASYDGFLSNGQNFYMYLDPQSNRFGFIPWDLDHGWGDFPFVGTASDRDQASIWRPWAGKHRLLERVMKVERFRELYRQQLDELLKREFNPDRLEPIVNGIAAVIEQPIEYDNSFRHQRFKVAVGDDWGDPPPNVDAALRPVNAIKRFIAARSTSVRDQLNGTSEGVVLQPMTGPQER